MKNKSDEEKVSEYINKNVENNFLNHKLEKGAVVLGILPGSVAERAGVRKGDCILAVNGSAVQSLNDYVKLIEDRKDTMKIDIIRGNEYKELVLNFGTSVN